MSVVFLLACGGKPSMVTDGGAGSGGSSAGGSAAGGSGGAGGGSGGAGGGSGGAAGGDDAGMAGGAGGMSGGAGGMSGGAGGMSGGSGGAGNTAPVLGALSPLQVNEGATAQVTLTATDAENDLLTFSLVGNPAFVTLSGSTVTVAPGFSAAGSYPVGVVVSDGQLQANGVLQVTVANVNRPPVLAAIADQNLTAGTPSPLTLMATDPDGDAVTFSAMNLPAYAVLSGGVITFSPPAATLDNRVVVVTAADPSNATDGKSFTLTVSPAPNQAPTVSALAQVDASGNPVAAGAMAMVAPRLRASVDDPENAQVKLEAEVVSSAAAFADVATHSGALGPEGQVELALPSLPAGSYKWQVRALDAAGKAGAWSQFAGGGVAFVVPAGAISGSIVISGGLPATKDPAVTLTLAATASGGATITEMCFSNDGTTFSQCGAPVSNKAWTLAAGEGLRAAYLRVRDSNNTTVVFFDDIVVDLTPPNIVAFQIELGKAATGTTAVSLSWTAADALSGLKAEEASNDAVSFIGLGSSPAMWTLPSAEGVRTVTLRVVDVAGNIATATDTIVYDKTPPSISSATLNAGAAWAKSPVVSLTVSAIDGAGSGVAQICYAGPVTAGCQPFGNGTVSVALTGGDGQKTLDVTVVDGVGLSSAVSHPAIGLDTVPPVLSSLALNLGAAWASSNAVSVGFSATEGGSGLAGIACATDGAAFGAPAAYANPYSYAVVGGDGMHTVSCKVLDVAGNESGVQSDGIGIDTQRPTGTVVVNAGDPQYTKQVGVSLVLSPSDAASGVTHYCANLTNTGPTGANDPCWTSLANTGFTLTGPDGLKTVYVWFRDAALNFSSGSGASDTITLDVTPPTVSVSGAGLGLAAGAAFTNALAPSFVNLASDATSGLSQVCTGTSSPPASCVAYAASASLAFSAGDGPKTGYLMVIDGAGNPSAVVTDTITLDQTPPTLSNVQVNANAAFTNALDVSVTSTASDTNGVTQLQLSNDGVTFQPAVAYASPKTYTLPAGDGAKSVYLRVLDAAGNPSAAQSDAITLDLTPPTVSISVNAGARYTQTGTVSVALTPSEAGSGAAKVCLKNTANPAAAPAAPPAADPCFLTFATPVMYTLSAQNDRRVYAWLLDGAGNVTVSPATYDIWWDPTAPGAPGTATATAGHRSVGLSWGASGGDASSGVAGYQVGVSTVSGGPYTYGATLPGTSTTLTLSNGATWYFVVRTVDNAGNTSSNTPMVSSTPRWPFNAQQRLPTSNGLNTLAVSPPTGRWFVAGEAGALYVSDDAFGTFTRRDPMTDGAVEAVYADASSNVWVVGAAGHLARSTDDGVTFSTVTNQDSAMPKRSLNAFTYAGLTGAILSVSHWVAVGAGGVLLHAGTTALAPTPVFAPVTNPAGASSLSAVARCNSAGVCAAGATLVAVGNSGVILRSTDNGLTWVTVPAPSGYTSASFKAVAALPGTDTMYIGGAAPAGHGPLLRSTNGGASFAEVVSPNVSDLTDVAGLSGLGSDLWVAGYGGGTQVLRINGASRFDQTFPSTLSPNAIMARSATEIATVAASGEIMLETAAATFVKKSVGIGQSVLGSSTPGNFGGTLWQVGGNGWVAFTSTSGSTWTQQTSATNLSLNAISTVDTNGAASGVFAFAVGTAGTIVKTTNGGTTWALDADSGNVSQVLNGVSCRSTTSCVAVGNAGTVLLWNGSSWTTDQTGGAKDYNAVVSYLAGGIFHVVAVGDAGLLRTQIGATWVTRPDISTDDFYGVAQKSDALGVVIAVGSGGKIYKSTNHGQSFTARTSGTTQMLRAVANLAGTSRWYAAGLGGTALVSDDDGETWAPLVSNTTNSIFSISTGTVASRVWMTGSAGLSLYSFTSGQ
ncbi:MAG: hypothetical protein IPJ65_10680 [Archangiaceae bacterium]|nr:hypothetical protein [Archangiaceae bacterium]